MASALDEGQTRRFPPCSGAARTLAAAIPLAAFLAAGFAGESVATAQTKLGPERNSRATPTRERAVAPQRGVVIVFTGVAGAAVRLEPVGRRGRLATVRAGADGGATFERLSPGPYRVFASAPEHRDTTAETVVAAGHTVRVDARLVPSYGTLVLTGPDLTAAARILVDGQEPPAGSIARDDDGRVRVKVAPGERDLVVMAPLRAPCRERIRIDAGEESPVAVALPLLPGRVRIRTTAGADVYVDGAPSGRVPSSGELAVDVSPVATHEIRVEADGSEPFAGNASAAPGAETLVAVELHRIPTTGPFGDAFISESLELWDAPQEWSVVPARQTLVVRGTGIGLARRVHYEDVEIEFNLRIVDGPGAAWVVRGSSKGTGYVFLLTGPAAPWPSQLRVCALENGRFDGSRVIFAPLPVIPDLVAGESYTVRVRVEGNSVRTWLRSGASGQSVSVGNFIDTDNRFRAGSIGFAGLGGQFEVNGVEARPIDTDQKPARSPN